MGTAIKKAWHAFKKMFFVVAAANGRQATKELPETATRQIEN